MAQSLIRKGLLAFPFTVVALLVINSAALAAEPRAIQIGVVQAEGMSPEQKDQVKSRLREEILLTGHWKVVEQNHQSIVQEKALAQAGVSVPAEASADSIVSSDGETAGANSVGVNSAEFNSTGILFTFLYRTGDITTLELRLTEKSSSRVLRSAIVDDKTDFVGVLRNLIPAAVKKLGGEASEFANIFVLDSATHQKTAAVLEMEANGVDEKIARGLTRRLRAELFQTGHFVVLEREKMGDILKEQALQQAVCQTEECMVQMGQMMGVQYMVGASVSRIGPMFSVSARLINVSTGQIMRSATIDLAGSVEDVLQESMNDIARTLAGKPLLQRTNWKAWSWFGGGTTAAALSGFLLWKGLDAHTQYDEETRSLDDLRDYKQSAQLNYILSGASLGLAVGAWGMALYYALTPEKELRVQDSPGAVSLGETKMRVSLLAVPGKMALILHF